MHSQIQIQIFFFHDESPSKWQKVEWCTRENTACSLIIALFINSQTQPLWIYVIATFRFYSSKVQFESICDTDFLTYCEVFGKKQTQQSACVIKMVKSRFEFMQK